MERRGERDDAEPLQKPQRGDRGVEVEARREGGSERETDQMGRHGGWLPGRRLRGQADLPCFASPRRERDTERQRQKDQKHEAPFRGAPGPRAGARSVGLRGPMLIYYTLCLLV